MRFNKARLNTAAPAATRASMGDLYFLKIYGFSIVFCPFGRYYYEGASKNSGFQKFLP
jgi:hypothetical protein